MFLQYDRCGILPERRDDRYGIRALNLSLVDADARRLQQAADLPGEPLHHGTDPEARRRRQGRDTRFLGKDLFAFDVAIKTRAGLAAQDPRGETQAEFRRRPETRVLIVLSVNLF